MGYDIKTIDKNSNEFRLIEAKGSTSSQPVINITANEFSTLTQKQNSYVYVISDALLDPLIHIIKGADLLKPKKDMRFSYGDWKKVEEESIEFLGIIKS